MALCTVSRGYGGRGARGGGSRSRGEASVRLPLSPRTLCAPGAGGGAHVHAQGTGPGATTAAPTGPPGTGNNPGTEEGSGLPDEPMVIIFFRDFSYDLLFNFIDRKIEKRERGLFKFSLKFIFIYAVFPYERIF